VTHPGELTSHPSPTELAQASWSKASASTGSQSCVEVAHLESWTVVRDSKNPDGPVHAYTPQEWACFLDAVRAGKFDRP
jgi:hypothetical protein